MSLGGIAKLRSLLNSEFLWLVKTWLEKLKMTLSASCNVTDLS